MIECENTPKEITNPLQRAAERPYQGFYPAMEMPQMRLSDAVSSQIRHLSSVYF